LRRPYLTRSTQPHETRYQQLLNLKRESFVEDNTYKRSLKDQRVVNGFALGTKANEPLPDVGNPTGYEEGNGQRSQPQPILSGIRRESDDTEHARTNPLVVVPLLRLDALLRKRVARHDLRIWARADDAARPSLQVDSAHV